MLYHTKGEYGFTAKRLRRETRPFFVKLGRNRLFSEKSENGHTRYTHSHTPSVYAGLRWFQVTHKAHTFTHTFKKNREKSKENRILHTLHTLYTRF